MLLTNNTFNYILNKNQLSEIFFSGCKLKENIGVESEKLLVYKDSLKAVNYSDISKILNSFDGKKWQKVFENGNIIGLRGTDGNISIEPGSQIEISLNPINKIDEIAAKLSEFYSQLNIFAQKINAMVLDRGIQPVSTFEDIEVIPKKRYEYMTKYLPSSGLTPFIMMRETAGIQANFDYKSEEDAIRKLSLALKMSPVISAIYSNSSVRGGKQTGFKSFRANSWLNVDEDRCGYISKKLFNKNTDFTFFDYTDVLLEVPMIFIQRGNKYIEAPITFREFMQKGYMGLMPDLSDWETHLSLFFPDVRLKSYIEIRNHDAQNAEMTFSVPAFWKGIMYNSDAMDEIEKILEKYDYEDFMILRKDAPVLGINARLKNYKIIDFVKEFFDISYTSLKSEKTGEEKYLEPVYEYIALKKVPADNII